MGVRGVVASIVENLEKVKLTPDAAAAASQVNSIDLETSILSVNCSY